MSSPSSTIFLDRSDLCLFVCIYTAIQLKNTHTHIQCSDRKPQTSTRTWTSELGGTGWLLGWLDLGPGIVSNPPPPTYLHHLHHLHHHLRLRLRPLLSQLSHTHTHTHTRARTPQPLNQPLTTNHGQLTTHTTFVLRFASISTSTLASTLTSAFTSTSISPKYDCHPPSGSSLPSPHPAKRALSNDCVTAVTPPWRLLPSSALRVHHPPLASAHRDPTNTYPSRPHDPLRL